MNRIIIKGRTASKIFGKVLFCLFWLVLDQKLILVTQKFGGW